jgi:hypothetical protein
MRSNNKIFTIEAQIEAQLKRAERWDERDLRRSVGFTRHYASATVASPPQVEAQVAHSVVMENARQVAK